MTIESLGKWPISGEEARRKKEHILITRDKMLHVIHGKDHAMPVSFLVSNDLVHMAEFVLPPSAEGVRTSEPESHKGDEVLYVIDGPVTVFLPEELETFEVKEGEAMLIPEGVKHQYQNFTDKVIKAVFSIAPEL